MENPELKAMPTDEKAVQLGLQRKVHEMAHYLLKFKRPVH